MTLCIVFSTSSLRFTIYTFFSLFSFLSMSFCCPVLVNTKNLSLFSPLCAKKVFQKNQCFFITLNCSMLICHQYMYFASSTQYSTFLHFHPFLIDISLWHHQESWVFSSLFQMMCQLRSLSNNYPTFRKKKLFIYYLLVCGD